MSRKKKITLEYEDGSKEVCEVVVDFTDGGKTKGVPAAEVIKYLKKLKRERK